MLARSIMILNINSLTSPKKLEKLKIFINKLATMILFTLVIIILIEILDIILLGKVLMAIN